MWALTSPNASYPQPKRQPAADRVPARPAHTAASEERCAELQHAEGCNSHVGKLSKRCPRLRHQYPGPNRVGSPATRKRVGPWRGRGPPKWRLQKKCRPRGRIATSSVTRTDGAAPLKAASCPQRGGWVSNQQGIEPGRRLFFGPPQRSWSYPHTGFDTAFEPSTALESR